MALLCAASVTGCGNDTAEEKSGDSEVLMVDADQTTAETTTTTEADEETTTEAEETTDEDASTKTTAKTTGTKKSSNKKSTTVKKTAGAASDSDEEDADTSSILNISKTDNNQIKLEFIKNKPENGFYLTYAIRFRNSGSTYDPFNFRFMELYNSLCNYYENYQPNHKEKQLQK